jgi:hypothetical protein
MTIARNAERVASDWTGASVGSGALYSGHNDNSPATALPASGSDADGYSGTGNSAPSNQRRTLTLSNGSVIWDLPGNVWEHVLRDAQDTLTTDADHPDTATGGAAFAWREFTALTGYGALSYDVIRPSNSSWDATHGMGRIYTCDQCAGVTARVFLRGGRWDSGPYAGAFTLYLNWVPSTQNSDVGFRCAR